MNCGRSPTIVVVHEHAGVLELVEASLRDRGARVLATCRSLEVLEIARSLKIDLLVVSRTQDDVAPVLRSLQPELATVVLEDEPISLEEITDAVANALAPRQHESPS